MQYHWINFFKISFKVSPLFLCYWPYTLFVNTYCLSLGLFGNNPSLFQTQTLSTVFRSVTSGSCSKDVSRKKFPEFFNVRVAALELFNETKDSVAVTLPDLTHDAKRLAPFDVTELPQAGVGGKHGGGVFLCVRASGRACVCVCVWKCVMKLRVPSSATNGRLIVTRDETMCDEFNT